MSLTELLVQRLRFSRSALTEGFEQEEAALCAAVVNRQLAVFARSRGRANIEGGIRTIAMHGSLKLGRYRDGWAHLARLRGHRSELATMEKTPSTLNVEIDLPVGDALALLRALKSHPEVETIAVRADPEVSRFLGWLGLPPVATADEAAPLTLISACLGAAPAPRAEFVHVATHDDCIGLTWRAGGATPDQCWRAVDIEWMIQQCADWQGRIAIVQRDVTDAELSVLTSGWPRSRYIFPADRSLLAVAKLACDVGAYLAVDNTMVMVRDWLNKPSAMLMTSGLDYRWNARALDSAWHPNVELC